MEPFQLVSVATCTEWMAAGWVVFIPIWVIARASLGNF